MVGPETSLVTLIGLDIVELAATSVVVAVMVCAAAVKPVVSMVAAKAPEEQVAPAPEFDPSTRIVTV